MKNKIIYVKEHITRDEYIDFLKRSDLGSQYPKERFLERIEKLVKSVSISIIAKDMDKIVGVIFGVTDFSYWLFVTDLGVDRDYVHQGIGKTLIKMALDEAGGKDDIALYLVANSDATGFYEKIGLKKSSDVMEFNQVEWTNFVVK